MTGSIPSTADCNSPSSTTFRPSSSESFYTTSTLTATDGDAIRAGIPTGYSLKHWNPNERPIILLGSVFDADSLRKWIFGWTALRHGASSPMSDIAGGLWLLLIKLAGKMKRAVKNRDRQLDLIDDFIPSGNRLWKSIEQLLKSCEPFMLMTVGQDVGFEFVDSLLGRGHELENTIKIMAKTRLWSFRFDANCGEIFAAREGGEKTSREYSKSCGLNDVSTY